MARPSGVRVTRMVKAASAGERGADDEHLHVGELHREVALAEHLHPAAQHRLHRLDARALADLHVVLQHDGQADGGDQRRERKEPRSGR
jgi:hypothetical protein